MKDLRQMAEELWKEAKRQGMAIESITYSNNQMVNGESKLVRVDFVGRLVEKSEVVE